MPLAITKEQRRQLARSAAENHVIFERSFLVFSAEVAGANFGKNQVATFTAESILRDEGIPYIRCRGAYKGNAENSFLVNLRDTNVPQILELAAEFEQESILCVGPAAETDDVEGWLIDVENRRFTPLGRLRGLCLDDLPNVNAYTEIGDVLFTFEEGE